MQRLATQKSPRLPRNSLGDLEGRRDFCDALTSGVHLRYLGTSPSITLLYYSSPLECPLAREYCSSRPDLISHLDDALALLGVVSILRRLLVPADSRSPGLYFPSLGQKIRICLVSCLGQPHSQLAENTPGTLHWNRN